MSTQPSWIYDEDRPIVPMDPDAIKVAELHELLNGLDAQVEGAFEHQEQRKASLEYAQAWVRDLKAELKDATDNLRTMQKARSLVVQQLTAIELPY